MLKTHFIGKVLPSAVSVSIGGTPQAKWDDPQIGLEMNFKVHIRNSVVDVECDTNRFLAEDLPHLYMRALDLSRAAVHLVGFAKGYGLTVFLDAFTSPDGAQSPLLMQDPRLPAFCTAFGINAKTQEGNSAFEEVCQIVMSEPSLYMAMNDLIASITLPHDAPVNCARAMEALRNLVAPREQRKDGWTILRNNLQLGQEYLEFVTGYSIGPRHGDRIHIQGHIVSEITKRSWIVMNRFLEFKKRGNKPLPVSEFPLLTACDRDA